MRAYLVATPTSGGKYAGTQAQASAAKKAYLDAGAKRSEVTVTEVEIPTAKAELIDFINKLVSA